MRRTLVAGNWKMNGSLHANKALLDGIKVGVAQVAACELLVCAPSPYLAQCSQELQGSTVFWGAQNVSEHESGAYTGEVSAAMLVEFGCTHVILGHSERRTYQGETNALVAKKVLRTLQAGMTPIICVGETLSERQAGRTDVVVGQQLDVVLQALELADVARIVVAYEPLWAIGTGITATPKMAQTVHEVLRSMIASRNQEAAQQVRILYGGSMKPDNAAQLMAMPDIDGGLIGGAALKSEDFLAIAQAAQAVKG
ncbi:MAG TPA: triose-phosphate isomerase [Burkholderiaceae bacterium]|jgi:triosephosphate isomerase